MWNQFNTANYEGMIAETVTIKGHNGDQINAYSARPIGSGPYPSIVLIHHLPGWDELYREFARRFAHQGFVVICPDLFARFGQGSPDDIASAAVYLASEEAASITGEDMNVSAGVVMY